ncbi:MAG TPA: FHA domain-containing protein [Ktedonosporobacter sp.]|nr:FHA domain-containing protein [Ktedonosporobacter sp.]
MFSIAANALYTTLRHRGTTRQLASAIITCVVSALLLLPAVVWFTMRFSVKQAVISTAEIEVALAYVALCGWLLPLSITAAYYLFALPRSTNTALHIPRQKGTPLQTTARSQPPRSQAGIVVPFVFSEDTPWCWLEYRSGNFQGQRLALKRVIATIGRDEQCDIWLDDDMASRHHAELSWHEGQAYLTDCESMNGVQLNGKVVRGSVPLTSNDIIEVGSHRFLFTLTEHTAASADDDPLVRHKWRSSMDALNQSSTHLPSTTQLGIGTPNLKMPSHEATSDHSQQTADEIKRHPQSPFASRRGTLLFQSGELVGKSFLLNQPVITLGRGIECDIVINDIGMSRWHIQFLHQLDGDYVQDLSNQNAASSTSNSSASETSAAITATINNQLIAKPQLLQTGDIIRVGSIQMTYIAGQMARTTPLPPTFLPSSSPLQGMQQFPSSQPGSSPRHGPVPLRLPSRPREQ